MSRARHAALIAALALGAWGALATCHRSESTSSAPESTTNGGGARPVAAEGLPLPGVAARRLAAAPQHAFAATVPAAVMAAFPSPITSPGRTARLTMGTSAGLAVATAITPALRSARLVAVERSPGPEVQTRSLRPLVDAGSWLRHTASQAVLIASISASTSAGSKRRQKSPAVVGARIDFAPSESRNAASLRRSSMSSSIWPPAGALNAKLWDDLDCAPRGAEATRCPVRRRLSPRARAPCVAASHRARQWRAPRSRPRAVACCSRHRAGAAAHCPMVAGGRCRRRQRRPGRRRGS
jgi:hypothetical protein